MSKEKSKEKKKRTWLLWLKRIGIVILLGVLSFFGFIWYANSAASRAGDGILFDDITEVPEREVGLVFGCSQYLGERENLYFKYRIEAAAQLWKAGKVKYLLVSGDNRKKYYNEPRDMRNALIEAGVPEENIIHDLAGLRTLDSVVRAKEIFGLDKLTLISQKFQNERAAYIAKAHKIDVVGFNAKAVTGPGAERTEDREVLARVKMWLDVNITRERPKHLGDEEEAPWRK